MTGGTWLLNNDHATIVRPSSTAANNTKAERLLPLRAGA